MRDFKEDLRTIGGLGFGLIVQLLCYTGMFASLAIAVRILTPTDFGIYASAVATATFLGSVMTIGADRLLLRQLVKYGSEVGLPAKFRSPLLVPFFAVNIIVILSTVLLVANEVTSHFLLFVTALASLTAGRIVLSAYFKHQGRRTTNIIATFGLQPLMVTATFLVIRPIMPNIDPDSLLFWWFYTTLFWEGIQLIILLVIAGSRALAIDFSHVTIRTSRAYAKAGLVLALWALLAMTSLLSVALGSLLFDPASIGQYTLAFRTSQMLGFFFSGASQILIPLSLRAGVSEAGLKTSREIRLILRTTLVVVGTGIGIFAIFGNFITHLLFDEVNFALYNAILILSVANVALVAFGIGDQIMVTVGLHKEAFYIAIVAGLAFAALFILNFIVDGGIVGLAMATTASIALRCYLSYLGVRRHVRVPVAVFDPLPKP